MIALSASYGAGGSRIGPDLARRLDVPFFDRAIPRAVASGLAVPLEAALAHEEQPASAIGRLLARLAPLADVYGAPGISPDVGLVDDASYRAQVEQVIRDLAAAGRGVLLGRGGAAVLRDDPRVLRVRLDGPRDARVAQAQAAEGVDEEAATRAQHETDRARDAYLRHFHGADPHDISLYHLVIDSTAIPLPTCVELIERAAQRLPRRKGAS